MSKAIRAGALFLALLMLFSLSACSVFSTKMAAAIQKTSKLRSFHVDVEASLELALCLDASRDPEAEAEDGEDASAAEGARQELPLRGSFTGSGECYTDPFQLHLDTELSLPGSSSKRLIYGEKDENAYYFYSRLNDGSIWQKNGLAAWSAGKIDGVKYLVQAADFFEASGTETVGGYTATRYDGAIPGEYLSGLFTLYRLREFLCDGLGLQLAEGVLEETADVPASIWLDTESGMIVRLDADLGAFGRAASEKQLAAARGALGFGSLGLSLELRDLRVSMRFSDFNGAADFQIPDEAKSAWGEKTQPWEK